MIAYTGIETVSNLAEEARDPPRDIPRSIRLVAVAVFAIYFTLPLIALSALPVTKVGRSLRDEARAAAGGGRLRERPRARARQEPGPARLRAPLAGDLRRPAGGDDPARRDERGRDRRIADHVLDGDLQAAAGGVPAAASALQDALARASSSSRASPRSRSSCPARRSSSARCTRSARCSRSRSRTRRSWRCASGIRDEELVYRARPNLRFRGIDWPLFAILGGLGTGIAWLVVRRPGGDDALGRARLARAGLRGLRGLPAARRARIPLRETVRAARDRARPRGRVPDDPRPGAAHRRVGGGARRGRAARHRASGARSSILHVLEVPLDQPLDAELPDREDDGVRDPRRGAGAARVLRGRQVVSRLVRGAQRRARRSSTSLRAGTPSWSSSEPRAGRSAEASRSSAERSTSCCETARRESR